MLSTQFNESNRKHRLLLVLLNRALIDPGGFLGYFANQYRIVQQNQQRAAPPKAIRAEHQSTTNTSRLFCPKIFSSNQSATVLGEPRRSNNTPGAS